MMKYSAWIDHGLTLTQAEEWAAEFSARGEVLTEIRVGSRHYDEFAQRGCARARLLLMPLKGELPQSSVRISLSLLPNLIEVIEDHAVGEDQALLITKGAKT